MIITEITEKIEEIDGEKVYILEKHMKTGVERLKELARMNKDDGVLTMLNKDMEFICEKQNFAMAFRYLKCPKCGGEISREAIWTEDE